MSVCTSSCSLHLTTMGGISDSLSGHFTWKYRLISDVCVHFILFTSSDNYGGDISDSLSGHFIWKIEHTCHFMLCFTEGLFILHTKGLIMKTGDETITFIYNSNKWKRPSNILTSLKFVLLIFTVTLIMAVTAYMAQHYIFTWHQEQWTSNATSTLHHINTWPFITHFFSTFTSPPICYPW